MTGLNASQAQAARDIIAASKERERETIDADNMSPQQIREVWPELKRFLSDPCSTILIDNLERSYNDPVARAARYQRLKAARELKAEMRTERPR